MPKSYTVLAGDTFELIARRVYGLETLSSLISDANPGVTEPPPAGASLVIPDNPAALGLIPTATSAISDNEVTLKLGTDTLRFFTDVTINRSMDSFDRVRFGGPFEPDDLELRAALRPLQFDDISVDVGGVRLFTGTKVNVSTVLSASSNTVSVECYSKPGVLNDCTMPASASEKLEFRDATLITIANALAAKFGLGVEYIGDVGPVFEQVAIKNGATVYSFLVGLVRQRNMVIANTAAGKLLIQRPVTPGKPVAELTEGLSPLMSVAPQIQSQKYYSHVTGMQPAWHGEGGDQYTQVNPRLNGVVRPWTFNVPDTDGAGIQEAVEAKAGRMFASAVQYDITVSTWRDSSGVLWLPNTTINVISPRSMIYTSYEFLIRSVSLTRSASGETATLKCILPGSLSGTVPETMPWD